MATRNYPSAVCYTWSNREGIGKIGGKRIPVESCNKQMFSTYRSSTYQIGLDRTVRMDKVKINSDFSVD